VDGHVEGGRGTWQNKRESKFGKKVEKCEIIVRAVCGVYGRLTWKISQLKIIREFLKLFKIILGQYTILLKKI
jgi:hypothetical protein